jgi:hypothetical protein
MIYNHWLERIRILASTINKESVRGELDKPNYHVFSKEKVKWYDLADDRVGRFKKHKPDFQEQLDLCIKSKL